MPDTLPTDRVSGLAGGIQFRPFDVTHYYEYEWDNYRFICYELTLILISALLRQGRYSDVAIIVDSTYFYDSNTDRQAHAGIDLFDNYIRSLDDTRNRRLGLGRVSVTADILKERAAGSDSPFNDLLTTDLLLHYLTFLHVDPKVSFWQSKIWFPRLSPYAHYYESIPILQKLVSARHFERVKILFGVSTPNELKQVVQRAIDEKFGYYQNLGTFDFAIPNLGSAIPLDRLATVP